MKRKHPFFIAHFILIVLFLWGTAVSPVYAHAVPETSTPRPNVVLETSPTEIRIQFNEPVVPNLSRISVLTQIGQAIETGALTTADADGRILMVTLPQPLHDGAYLVSWQALSAVDGHNTSGSFSFGVGDTELTAVSADASVQVNVSPMSAAARWLTLTGLSLLMGLFAFRLLVWNPIVADVELEPAEEQLDLNHAQTGIKIGLAGLIILVLALVLIFIDQTTSYKLLQLDNFQIWIGTQFGAMWLIRLFLVAVSHFNLSLFVDVKNGRQELRGWEWWAGLILAVGLALTSAMVSHSAALSNDTAQAILIDWLHVLAATIWVGGLVYLALALWQARHLPKDTRLWLNLSLMLNFSAIAAIAVGSLTASGLYLGWRHVGGWAAFVGTVYGLLLLAKLAVALIVFLIAGFNLFILKPRLHAAYDNSDSKETMHPEVMQQFSRVVQIEMGVALLILLLAGVLTDLQRGVDAPLLADAPGQTVVTYETDDIAVDMTIEPALVGPNQFEIELTDVNGNPVTDDDLEVTIRYTFLGQSIGADSAVAERVGNGRYLVEGSYISLIGPWQVEVGIRRPGIYDTFAPFRLEAGLGGNIRPLDSGTRPLEKFAQWMTLAGSGGTGLALILMALLWGFIATRAARAEWQLIPLLALSLIAFGIGSQQMINFFDKQYTPAKFTTNPILPDIESVAMGKQLFADNCIACHGPEGRGDGPSALTLNPPPVDFTDGHTATHTDGDLFYWILQGVDGSAMPAFEETVTREQAWHLVNYVRRLSVGQG
ncbi:MAG: copper resistance protein CopC [Anaerolineales bacterium]|nr:copper resistance protein CopC [Anaerolineales bacterium]